MTATRRTTLAAVAAVGILTVTAAMSGTAVPSSRDSTTPNTAVRADADPDVGHAPLVTTTTFADVVTSTAARNPTDDSVVEYSRFGDADPLSNEVRQRLYEVVTEDPGVYVTELARRTDTHVSTVRYHVRVLVDEGLVDRTTARGRSRLSPADVESPTRVDGDTRTAILASLHRRGPAPGGELADRLDLAESTLSYHLQRLEDDGLVRRDTDGRTVVNALAAGAEKSVVRAED